MNIEEQRCVYDIQVKIRSKVEFVTFFTFSDILFHEEMMIMMMYDKCHQIK